MYGSGRDASFVRGINRELINKIIDTEVAIYQLSLESTKANIYDESQNKYYFDPVRQRSLIEKGSKTQEASDTGIDVNRETSFGFIKQDLKDINLVLKTGDIIWWDGDYYEVDLVSSSTTWGNRSPSELIGFVEKEIPEFGYGIHVTAQCHLTRQTKLNMAPTNVGKLDTALVKNATKRKSIYD